MSDDTISTTGTYNIGDTWRFDVRPLNKDDTPIEIGEIYNGIPWLVIAVKAQHLPVQ
jgi:hypothetical protein